MQPKRKRIAILNDYQRVALSFADWSSLDAEVVPFHGDFTDETELLEALTDFDVLCVMRERTPLRRNVLKKLPRLKLIASTARGNASIDMEAASELGIAVSWTDHPAYGASELCWALIMAATRRIPTEASALRSGGWQTQVGMDIHGRTLGVVGLGNFGKAVARVGRAFGMNVIAWSQNLDPAIAAEEQVQAVDKLTLFREADIVSIHLVLSDRTRGIVGGDEIALMKPTALLVNTARGPIVDEPALVEALMANKIAGAALDVFEQEPLPEDHPFRHLPNVLATPHIGYVTEDTYRMFYGQTVQNIAAWLAGTPIRTVLPALRK